MTGGRGWWGGDEGGVGGSSKYFEGPVCTTVSLLVATAEASGGVARFGLFGAPLKKIWPLLKLVGLEIFANLLSFF